MKKLISVVLVLILLAGCGGPKPAASAPAPAPAETAVPTEAPAETAASTEVPVEAAVPGLQEQQVRSTFHGHSYDDITVKAGQPVVWTIDIDEAELNGCNEVFVVPKLDLQVELQPGENVVRFTPPDSPTTLKYSCWMGMIRGAIKVVE